MAHRDTPLARWLREATPAERDRMATLAGTSVNYLYQVAACRREPRVGLAFGIEQSTRQIWAETSGRLPIVTASEIASMYALEGL